MLLPRPKVKLKQTKGYLTNSIPGFEVALDLLTEVFIKPTLQKKDVNKSITTYSKYSSYSGQFYKKRLLLFMWIKVEKGKKT